MGTPIFRNLYVEIDGKEFDATENGNKSCAAFISGILSIFGLIDEGHATVDRTIVHLKEASWFEVDISKPEAWDVVIYKAITYSDGSSHKHMSFYIGDDQAISNNRNIGSPQQHHWLFDGTRKPIMILRYDFSKKLGN